MTICVAPIRFSLGILLLVVSQIDFSQAASSTFFEANGALLLRVLQYETVLGFELEPKVSLCVDEAMGRHWFLGDDPSQVVRQSTSDKLRQLADTCPVALSSEKARLAAQLRALTERQLKLAQRIEKPAAVARGCITKSTSAAELKICLTSVFGKPPPESEWGHWLVLYERRAPG